VTTTLNRSGTDAKGCGLAEDHAATACRSALKSRPGTCDPARTEREALAGGKPLLISLIEDGTALPEPRLVTDGDVKGGRYVSGVRIIVCI
jgi:hypothetical protein